MLIKISVNKLVNEGRRLFSLLFSRASREFSILLWVVRHKYAPIFWYQLYVNCTHYFSEIQNRKTLPAPADYLA